MTTPDPPFSLAHYRRLVAELEACIARRVRAERELVDEGHPEGDPEIAQLRRTAERLESDLQARLEAAGEQFATEQAAIDGRYRAEVSAAESEYAAAVREAESEHRRESDEIERTYSDNSWMMSSLLDDESEDSPKREFETFHTLIEGQRERLDSECREIEPLYRRATETVHRRWHWKGELPEAQPVPAASRDEAIERFDEAAAAAREQFRRLETAVLPRVLSGWRFLPMVLAAWVAVFAAVFFLVSPALVGLQTGPQVGSSAAVQGPWVLAAGLGSFVVIGLIAVVLWAVSSGQTWSAFTALHESVQSAHTARRRWTRRADAELARREKDFSERYSAIVARRESALQKFAAEHDERTTAVEQRKETALRDATRRREARLQQAVTGRGREQRALEGLHAQRMATIHEEAVRERSRLAEEIQCRQAEAERHQRLQRGRLTADWDAALERLHQTSEALIQRDREVTSSWGEVLDSAWQPATEIPEGLRLGDFRLRLADFAEGVPQDDSLQPVQTEFILPALLPFPHSPSLVIEAGAAGRDAAVSLLRVAMLRLLTHLPPNTVRFTVIDPVGLGEPFSAFMHLADFDDLLITHRIWTEPGHIEQQLADLTEHLENVFQKYLRNEFETIEDYNRHAGEVAEPYRVLVVSGFPESFSERAAARLRSIAANGPRCGVFPLISVDTRLPLPRGLELADLEQNATVLRWQKGAFRVGAGHSIKGGRVRSEVDGPALECGDSSPLSFSTSVEDSTSVESLQGVREKESGAKAPHSKVTSGRRTLALEADEPPPATEFTAIVRKLGDLSRHVRRVEVPFFRVTPPADRCWAGDSRKSIEVPLGRSGATKLQCLRLGVGTSQHVLVAGRTGSGKSTLLHVLITNLAMHYGPNEIEFFLIDFKKGVEFKTYATHDLPHARVVAVESDREFGISALERLDGILQERGELFRAEGVQDIGQYRDAHPSRPLPRILLIVDEFQEFFVQDDSHAQTATLLLDRLVRQGRAFGIHVLLGSQTLGGAYSLARTTLSQMAVRIALQTSEADAHLILSEENTAARLLTRPGEAIYNDANGVLAGNSLFQVAWLADEEHDEALERVRQLADARGLPPARPVVFEGNIPADPARNAELSERIERAAAGEAMDAVTRLWVGEPVSISGPTSVTLERQAGGNLLLVGADEPAATGILATSLISLDTIPGDVTSGEAAPGENGEHKVHEKHPRFVVLVGGHDEQAWSDVLDALPHAGLVVCPNDAAEAVGRLAAEVRRRSERTEPAPPIALLIHDLGKFRDLRRSEDDYGFGGFDRDKPLSPAQALAEILKDGPAVGVHAVVWANSYNTVERWLGRPLLREFEKRIAFAMSAADSSSLIDAPDAGRLGAYRALLYHDDRGTIEKFRPYGPPTPEWLQELRDRLQGRPTLADTESDIDSDIEVADDINEWTII